MTESLGQDPLAGLQHRWYVLHELERHIELYKRYWRPFSLLVIHFDNLDWVKETFGETAGDSALEYLATHIRMHLREADIACRSAEDQFVVIMQETEKEAAQAAGRRIADSVQSTRFKVGDASVIVKVSGVVASCPADGTEAEALLQAVGMRD
jgi:two-component system, cell cycle response regulator